MAPPILSLYTLSFFIAVLATLFVAATLRLLAILPTQQSKIRPWRKRPAATRVLIVLGSGGHTHEMFYLLRDLDTRKYTHRTYVVSSGDAFSAQRAKEFERVLEERWKEAKQRQKRSNGDVEIQVTDAEGRTRARKTKSGEVADMDKPPCLGPEHYNIAEIPRARKIHQPPRHDFSFLPLDSHFLLCASSPRSAAPARSSACHTVRARCR